MRRRAMLIHASSLASTQALQFGVSLALVRLLTPHELGLFAIASALVGAAHGARDLGVSAYLQREPALDAHRVGAALGLSCVASALLALAMTAWAPSLADAFGEPALAPLLRTLALGLVVVPVGAVMTALALRAGDADQLAKATAWGNASQAVVAVALAAAGAGAAGPAWGQVVNLAVCSLVVWPLRPRDLWAAPRFGGWRPILRLGRGTLLGSTLASLQGAAPTVLLGQLGGASSVGLLGRAQSLTALLPGLAGMALHFGATGRWARRHHRGGALAPAFAAASRRLTGLAWPLLAVAAAMADPLVSLLFGAAWLEAAPAVMPLALLAALMAAFNGLGPALTAVGRTGRAALPQAATLATWLVLAAAFALPPGAGGAQRFAYWLLLAGLVALPCQLWLCRRWLGLRPAVLMRALAAQAAVALVVGATARLALHLAASLARLEASSATAVLIGLAAALPTWWSAARFATFMRRRSARRTAAHRPSTTPPSDSAVPAGQAAPITARLRITTRK